MELKDWDTTAGNNNSAPPDGAPEGQAPGTLNDCIRENMAVLARWRSDNNGSLTATGTADAQALSANGSYTALTRGDSFVFRPVAANTGACTLNVSSLGAVSIKGQDGAELTAGALDPNGVASVVYDGMAFVLLGPAKSAALAALEAGTIDAVVIGGTTPAAGTFTTVAATVSGNIPALTVGTLTVNTSASIPGFVASARAVNTGNGCDGGGDLTADRTITVGAGNGLSQTATGLEMSGTYTGTFNATVDVGVTSDARVKRNFRDADWPALAKSLRPWLYERKDSGRDQYGFVAQELEQSLPEAVQGPERPGEMRSVSYQQVVPVLAGALQDALRRLEALEAKH